MSVNRTVAPPIHDAVDFEYVLPALNTTKLDNGLPLYWLNAGVQDVVQIEWVFPAGLWYEHKASVAQATAGLFKSGTSTQSAHEINEALEYYGAHLKVAASNDYATVSLHTMVRHLPRLLPVVYSLFTDNVFPQHELDIHKRNAAQKLLVNLRQCEFVANRQIDAFLFGAQHPYGRFSTSEGIAALTREDLLSFYQKQYALANAKIFMSGKVGDAEVALMNQIFGVALASSELPVRSQFDMVPATERIHRISNDPNGVQGAIRIGRLFPNRHHPDYTPMVVLNALFGGYFGSRLMSNIREEKGYTYGIYSSLSPEVSGGSLVIQTETGTAVAEDAVKEVYKEMDLLRNELVDEEELLLVKNYLLGGILGDLDGPFSIMRRWKSLILNGFDVNYFYNNVQLYKTITPDTLQLLAQKYLVPSEFYEVVVI